MVRKIYVDGYGYSDVNVVNALNEVPNTATYYGFDDDYVFYLDEFSDVELWAIPDEKYRKDGAI